MPGSTHFGFTKLIVKDLEGAATFYKEVFGLSELARVTAAVNDRPLDEILFNPTRDGGATFVLWKWQDAGGPSSDEVILGFETLDLAAVVEQAKAKGGAVAQEIKDMPEHGVRVAFVTDPEGHLIEVVELLSAQ